MKNFRKLFYAFIFLVSSSMSLLAVNPIHGTLAPTNQTEVLAKVYKSPVGTWNYTVEDVPYEYSAGVLIVTKEKDGYKVELKVNYNTLTATQVKVEKNIINFSVYIEGGQVQVSLEVNDDVIKGKANSPEGTFLLEGKRTKS